MCLWRDHWNVIQEKSATSLKNRGSPSEPNTLKWVSIFSWLKEIKPNIFILSISSTERMWNLPNLQGQLLRKKQYTSRSDSKFNTSNVMRDVTKSNPGSHTCRCMWLEINKNRRVSKEHLRQLDFCYGLD